MSVFALLVCSAQSWTAMPARGAEAGGVGVGSALSRGRDAMSSRSAALSLTVLSLAAHPSDVELTYCLDSLLSVSLGTRTTIGAVA
jgi:hypothetical protein